MLEAFKSWERDRRNTYPLLPEIPTDRAVIGMATEKMITTDVVIMPGDKVLVLKQDNLLEIWVPGMDVTWLVTPSAVKLP